MTDAAVTPPTRPRSGVLRARGITVRVRPWPADRDTAHVIFYHQSMLPEVHELDRWVDELAAQGFRRVRTTALATVASARFDRAGFSIVQELVLLQHDDPRSAPAPAHPTRRLDITEHDDAAAVDRAAFGDEWHLDAAAIADVRAATPRHRARCIGTIDAYAVTGRDSRQGFLQRLAVHPDAQRRGLGRALALDSLRSLARWRVTRVLVNTPVDNEPALALYRSLGFHPLPERLRVYERDCS